MTGKAELNRVTIIQRGSDLVKYIEWEVIQPRWRHGGQNEDKGEEEEELREEQNRMVGNRAGE